MLCVGATHRAQSSHRQPQWGGRRAGLYSGEAFFTVTAVADLPRRLECALIPSLQHSAAGGWGEQVGVRWGWGWGGWGDGGSEGVCLGTPANFCLIVQQNFKTLDYHS